MSVLETLVTLFTADTTGLKKGNAEAQKSTNDTEKKISTTDKAAEKLGGTLVNLAKEFSAVIGAGVGIWSIVNGLKAAAAQATLLSNLSLQTGDSTEQIDAWSSAVQHAGGNASEFQSTLVSMNNSLQDMQFNPKNAAVPYFRWLGISVRNSKGEIKSFLELLPELASAFEGMNPKQVQMLGRRIGLDQSTIMLLQKGRREVDAIIAKQKELGVITKQDTEIVRKFNAQWEDTAHGFRSIFTIVNSTILPVLTKILVAFESVSRFILRHSKLIEGALVGVGGVISYFLIPLIKRLGLAFAGIGGWIGLAIAAVALLYDDIKTYMEGGDSVIGRMAKKWPILGEVFKEIGRAVSDVWKLLNMDAGDFGKILTDVVIAAVEKLFEWVNKIGISLRSLLGLPQENISIDKNINVNNSKLPDDKSAGVNNLRIPGLETQKTIEAMNMGKRAINLADTSPISSQTNSSILNTSNNSASRNIDVRTGDINIQTQATDSKGIAFSIKDTLENQIRGAMGNFNDGVVA